MNLDPIIDSILSFVSDGNVYSEESIYHTHDTTNEVHFAIQKMIEDGLLYDNGDNVQITPRGTEINQMGGYLVYKEKEYLLSNKKVDDALLSKFNLQTRWIPIAISILSLIVAIAAIIVTLTKN